MPSSRVSAPIWTPMSETDFDLDHFLRHLSTGPGVYRMLDASGEVIYVGKAKNLKARVSSYFQGKDPSPKTRAMVARVARVEVTLTHTETEALILENTLIKRHRPRYNILYRDDKSYPYLHLTAGDYPRLALYRGARREGGRYFGPYPSAGAVRESLNLLQRLFRLRSCEDSVFRNRSRPCLQYQIERCSAPCVGYIDPQTYAEDVRHATLFLEGRDAEVVTILEQRMNAAAEALEFERAALYRDQIAALRQVQAQQYVSGERGDLDVVAAACRGGQCCVQVFFVRHGVNLGNKAFFPRLPEGEAGEAEALAAFLGQYYLGEGSREIPAEIIVGHPLVERELLATALSERAGRKVRLVERVRGQRARWLEMARRNAETALATRLASRDHLARRFEALQAALDLPEVPRRLECFDISHTRGEATVASCVVFEQDGPLKSHYRRFNIEGITPGDDFAAMRQALERRYRRLKQGEAPLPDLLIIDGGKGQLAQARSVLDELGIDGVALLGVAKGPERKPGRETLFLSPQGAPIILPADSPALHLIQQIRDEAHRFAIEGHRRRRAKARGRSPLEEIPGLGPKRRQALLRHFGGLQGVSRAGVEDLARVKGVSRALAERIYHHFHGDAP